jgi:Rrf2 family protein
MIQVMKLSQGVEWGLHCAAMLALSPAGAVVRREVLAGHYGLPDAYLAKHLHALTRSGLLHAVPGPKGGYRLARDPAKITVLDVVEAIDGGGKPFVCQEIRQQGSGALTPEQCRRTCAINVVMNRADMEWRNSLRSTTIADLVDRTPAWIKDRNRGVLADAVR